MQQREPDPTAQHLVELFEEQLNMSESADNMLVPSMHVKLQQSTVQPKNSAIKHSISQHYHHSNHIPIDSPIPTLRTLQHHPEDAVLHLLVQSDISPTSLLRSQLTLFEKSTPDERQKLIMLWRLAPPTFTKLGGQELADRLGEYQSTTMKQEVLCQSSIARPHRSRSSRTSRAQRPILPSTPSFPRYTVVPSSI